MSNSEWLQALEDIASLPRSIMGSAYDQAFDRIQCYAENLGATVECHCFSSGTECGTWAIPKEWRLKKAQLRRTNGEVLLDADWHPLHCASYSVPFSGRISRDKLMEHLHVCPWNPEAIPFVFHYYRPEWGLCCTADFRDSLQETEYDVEIDTSFVDGQLHVGEITFSGAFGESFLLISHLCHPCQVNDGPVAIFPILNMLAEMHKRGTNYTYRVLVLPETIGSIAWLSTNLHRLPSVAGGLFVEMLGTEAERPIMLNRSYRGDTLIDRIFETSLSSIDPAAIPYRFAYANDERQFNSPGVDIPVLAFSRGDFSDDNEGYAFRNYHTHLDNVQELNVEGVERSIRALTELLNRFDRFAVVPKPDFFGEPFLTKYGLHIDSFTGQEQALEYRDMMDIIFACDGHRSVWEIAEYLDATPDEVSQVIGKFAEAGLITLRSVARH